MPTRCLLILLDGLGDRSFPEFGDRTPLQAARTPNLDSLAAAGANGLLHAGRVGVPLPSENAHLALFGYNDEEFPGRGYLEALGAGMTPAPEDVAILAHFASVKQSGKTLVLNLDKPRFNKDEIDVLAGEIESFESEGVEISFSRTKNHEGIVVLSGPVSPFVTDTDPFVKGRRLIEPDSLARVKDDPDSIRTARVLKRYLLWCYETLKKHPVNEKRVKKGKLPLNAVVTQRPGRHKNVPSFTERWGMKGLSISSGIVYWGLCRFIGIDVFKARDTEDIARDFTGRLREALDRFGVYDFIHVHTKAPDTAAHEDGPERKKEAIEAIDRGLGELTEEIQNDKDLLTIVTSDHSTPCESVLIHSGEPVPIAIAGVGVRRDNIKHFDEVECAAGALGFVRGSELMYVVLNHLDRAKLRGSMDTPEDQPYWPGDYKPLSLE
ncbi:MAG: alkaline phosphatase family protein [Planctomycetota bacterium]|jgi:2,3-bisphosphoglycerate-independent phosphoglycerate mutase